MKNDICGGGGGMDNHELPPLVLVGQKPKNNAYLDALVKRVVFSDAALAKRWQARVAGLQVLPVSQRSMPASV